MKDKLVTICRWEHFWFCLLILVTLVMHFCIISSTYDHILDEAHYVNDANNIIENHQTARLEHPPLAKLFIVTGIHIFGDNPWGWRFFSVVFGTVTLVFFYFLCRRLGMSWLASNLATTLLAFENMTFVHAGVAMIDVYYVTFMMASFFFYIKMKYVTSGVLTGLSTLAKLNGALALPVIGVHWLFSKQKRHWWVILVFLFAVLTYLVLMMPLDLAILQGTEHFKDSYSRTIYMMETTGTLTFETVDHPSESYPWEWLLTYKPMAYHWTPNYVGGISPSIWALIMPTFLYLVFRAIKRDEAGLFGAAWFFGTFLVWIPATIITDRVTYPYYFYPTIGAICIGLGIFLAWLLEIFKKRGSGKLRWVLLSIVILYLMAHLASFVIMSPVFPIDASIFNWFKFEWLFG
ncbi:MAG TPA: phospholipid carrier-dependent glycosyltransferase [Dehalococcoidia bacterium]|nr:phospholipid carrier-dependent glycosyltransferase [Dehalococcoidia bacterium]